MDFRTEADKRVEQGNLLDAEKFHRRLIKGRRNRFFFIQAAVIAIIIRAFGHGLHDWKQAVIVGLILSAFLSGMGWCFYKGGGCLIACGWAIFIVTILFFIEILFHGL